MPKNDKHATHYKCRAAMGQMEFTDGTVLRIPPATRFEEMEILTKVAEKSKPKCKVCDSVQLPRMTAGKKGIAFQCPTCNRIKSLRHTYRDHSVEELEKIKEFKAQEFKELMFTFDLLIKENNAEEIPE